MTEKVKRTSKIISDIVESCVEDGVVTVDEFLKKMGLRAQSIAILVFAISAAVAGIVPGFSTLMALPILFIAFQMAIGGKSVGLPKNIRDKKISPRIIRAALSRSAPLLLKLECFLRPRLLMLTNPIAQRLIAIIIMVMAVVLLLPIPGGNFIPSITIALFALAILERDGYLLIAILGMLALTARLMIGLIMQAWNFIDMLFGAF
jgi:hypothetical protein